MIAEDGPAVTIELLRLVSTISSQGKQIHDANVIATMIAHGIPNLLTHNVGDFAVRGAHHRAPTHSPAPHEPISCTHASTPFRSTLMSRLAVALVILVAASPVSAAEPNVPETNLVFRNATIYDGTGKPPVTGDVHVKGDKIAAVGKIGKIDGATEIDATGLVLCPGFIDLHTHCDSGLTGKSGRGQQELRHAGLHDGRHRQLRLRTGRRRRVLQDARRAGASARTSFTWRRTTTSARRSWATPTARPTADELKKMEDLVDQAMTDGAWGLSTGLIYNPGTYAKTDEIIALAKIAGKHGGLYASHIRDESRRSARRHRGSHRDRPGRRLPRPHLAHQGVGARRRGACRPRAVGLIEDYRKKGEDVTADQYPYIASSTSLARHRRAVEVPRRHRRRTSSPASTTPTIGPRIKAESRRRSAVATAANASRSPVTHPNPKWHGKNIAAIAEAEGKEPVDIVLEIERNGGAQIVNFGMSEDDVRIYMKQPWVATASDGGVQTPGNTVPHPRSYGTFPRKIGHYAIEEKIVPLEAAIRSSTGLPADILKLTDRGYLKPGYFADVVVFDPTTFRDTATFDKPHQYAAGVKWVLVNGFPEIKDGQYQSAVLGGRALRWKKR